MQLVHARSWQSARRPLGQRWGPLNRSKRRKVGRIGRTRPTGAQRATRRLSCRTQSESVTKTVTLGTAPHLSKQMKSYRKSDRKWEVTAGQRKVFARREYLRRPIPGQAFTKHKNKHGIVRHSRFSVKVTGEGSAGGEMNSGSVSLVMSSRRHARAVSGQAPHSKYTDWITSRPSVWPNSARRAKGTPDMETHQHTHAVCECVSCVHSVFTSGKY